ncbi:cytochrome C554, partial [candidate division KSB1 bacterium]|nr:cytochrome C554 [candidate division KSB1 bacterium]NIR68444.1 cytochrome C554 [candidate division KSB1 bacterium]NIS22676.1 cytochrome C554 [candidate division KSB1 bacterium]NIT72273.1 cytochrome C554 [candidate division KSB1 bacterium]NIU28632.1 cytochrome C554 [candidate division KSB1 bacterium]
KSCKPCHLTKKSGAQFKIWEDGPHAKAFETLKTPEAKKVAKEAGIEGDPASAKECVRCHVTAFGVDEKLKTSRLTMEEGVSCEACHGPGSEYKSKKIIEAIYKGELDGAEYGLIEPTAEVCTQCHNEESPTFKGFDYEKMAAKIAHPVPKEE